MGLGVEKYLGLLLAILCSAGIGESATSCGGPLTADINRANLTFTNNLNITTLDQPCVWTITAANASHTVLLTLFDLNIEEGDECLEDSLKVYDGSEGSGQLVATWCGQMMEGRVQSTGQTLTLVYTVNSNNARGFDVNYVSESSVKRCKFVPDAKDSYLFIQSPGYPQSYPQNLYCTFEFGAAEHKQIKVEFLNVDLPPGENETCTSDHVTVYDGRSVRDIELKSIITRTSQVCGTDQPTYISTGEYMLLVFNTSQAENYKGFRLQYIQGNFSNQYIPPCGGDLMATDVSGTILSPNFPNGYPRRLRCKWTIRATNTSLKIVVYVHLDITGVTTSTSECLTSSDKLSIYDGTTTENKIATLCGVHLGLRKQSVSNAVTVIFTTALSETDVSGFALLYEQTDEKERCSSIFLKATRSEQTLTSPTYPSRYTWDTDCTWYLSSAIASDVIVVEVVNSDIENSEDCQNDWVAVYDGYSDKSPVLGKWCGNSTATYRSARYYLTIVLHSNRNVITGKGFKIKYKSEEKQEGEGPNTAAQAVKMTWSVLGMAVWMTLCSLP